MEEKKTGETKSEESEHESEEDESEILEESPCGRWLKRSEEVSQRNVPGIDRAYLAMDSEEGVEVVWNEVQFSERKSFKQQEEKIKAVFDNLMRIDHANIVKFHRYWIDYSKEQQKTRVVFITEYMSSGSVKEFLNKTKEVHKYKRTKSWKRWCTQILSALSYLHTCSPAVIHGNMTCDTIFIQHNGLVKIGSVAPDAIRNHVKTYHEVKRHMHYYAPEYETTGNITPAVDIYSFGICALEMAVPRSQLYYTESKSITAVDIERAIDVLDDPQQQDFIRLCLRKNPAERPSARSLLLHPLLFEVHSLKLLAAHAFVKNQRILPEYKQIEQDKDMVIAETTSANVKSVRLKDVPAFDIDKFLEDVLNGVYPLTSFALPPPQWAAPSSSPPQNKGQVAVDTPAEQPEEVVPETRRMIYAQGTLMPMEESYGLILQLRFEDKMNRHLNCEVLLDETADTLTTELVEHKLINELDNLVMKQLLEDGLKAIKNSKTPVHFTSVHLLDAETAYAIQPEIASGLQPVSQPSLIDDASYLLYQGLQNQMLPKQQATISEMMNPLMQQVIPVSQQLAMFQSMPQNMTISHQSLAPQGLGQPSVLNTIPLSQSVLQAQQFHQVVPNIAQSLDQANMANIAFAQPQTAGIFPLQYMQFLQQQQQQAVNGATQQPLASTNFQTQIQPVPPAVLQAQLMPPAMLQAQLMQQQMLQQMQPLYSQQQPALLQQSQPQVVQQVPVPIPEHLQSLPSQLQTHGLPQPVTLAPATTPANVLPLLSGQQPVIVSTQAPINPMLQLQALMPLIPSQAGDIQRSTSLFNMPPQQAQSINNSNNTVFSSSVISSEHDTEQILQQATPHSSVVSAGSSVSDPDMAVTNQSPPTSGTEAATGEVP